jgi:hypothetical protein
MIFLSFFGILPAIFGFVKSASSSSSSLLALRVVAPR